MKIAIPCENGSVFAHFGRTAQFKIYDVDMINKTILSAEVIDTDGFGHSSLAELLNDNAVELVLCGGLGSCAQNSLYEYGIQFLGGVSGPVDDVINAYLSQKLQCCEHPECCQGGGRRDHASCGGQGAHGGHGCCGGHGCH